jgi:hypothetical protein
VSVVRKLSARYVASNSTSLFARILIPHAAVSVSFLVGCDGRGNSE